MPWYPILSILFAALIIPLIALIVALLLKRFRKFSLWATERMLGSCMIVMALWGLLGPRCENAGSLKTSRKMTLNKTELVSGLPGEVLVPS